MKKKTLYFRIGIGAAIIFIIYLVIKPSTEKRLEQLFGITETVYEVEKIIDGLGNVSYDGYCMVVLLVEADEMQMLLDEVQVSGMVEANNETRESVAKSVKKSFNKTLSDGDILYVDSFDTKRGFLIRDIFHGVPRGSQRMMLYSEPEDGIYRVYLNYSE